MALLRIGCGRGGGTDAELCNMTTGVGQAPAYGPRSGQPLRLLLPVIAHALLSKSWDTCGETTFLQQGHLETKSTFWHYRWNQIDPLRMDFYWHGVHAGLCIP